MNDDALLAEMRRSVGEHLDRMFVADLVRAVSRESISEEEVDTVARRFDMLRALADDEGDVMAVAPRTLQ